MPSITDGANDAAAWRRRACPDDDAFLLGHFGFLKAIKGLDYLIEAMANLHAAGCKLRLLLIGGRSNSVDNSEDAAYLRRLEGRIQQLGLQDLVTWTGFLPDHEVAACFQAVDLMALPFTDGASFRRSSLIAALHNGCAVLTTEPAMNIDIFRHASNLWLVPARSSAAIEKALRRLMRDREQLTRLRAGAAELSAHFDWDVITRSTIDFLQSSI